MKHLAKSFLDAPWPSQDCCSSLRFAGKRYKGTRFVWQQLAFHSGRFYLGCIGSRIRRFRLAPLNVPHDWSIESVSRLVPCYSGRRCASGGFSWYRKTFTVRRTDRRQDHLHRLRRHLSQQYGLDQWQEVGISGRMASSRSAMIWRLIFFTEIRRMWLQWNWTIQSSPIRVGILEVVYSAMYGSWEPTRFLWIIGELTSQPEVTAEKNEVNIDVTVRNAGKAVPVTWELSSRIWMAKPICQAESKTRKRWKIRRSSRWRWRLRIRNSGYGESRSLQGGHRTSRQWQTGG